MARRGLTSGAFVLRPERRPKRLYSLSIRHRPQSLIEKRFAQFKTDFAVTPIYLPDMGPITGLLAVYFFPLVVHP